MKTYFIADTHFGHMNILKYEPIRIDEIWDTFYKDDPKFTKDSFKEFVLSLYENKTEDNMAQLKNILCQHDKMLIDNWNKVVKPLDTVWFLGDFSLVDKETTKELFSKLNGHIKMIMGNHDRYTPDFYRSCGVEYVSEYPIIVKKKIILSHAPLNIAPECGMINVFGHVHSKVLNIESHENNICICVEKLGFRPIRLSCYDKN